MCDKAFNIAKHPKYDRYQYKNSASLADNSASGSRIKNENISNK